MSAIADVQKSYSKGNLYVAKYGNETSLKSCCPKGMFRLHIPCCDKAIEVLMMITFFPRCACGHHKLLHESENVTDFSPGGDPWQANKHTTQSPTDAFGQIDFQGGTATSFATKAQVRAR